jgi:hypothetical protein
MDASAWIALVAVSITAALAALGGVVWLVRLEGRVNAGKSETEAMKTDLIGVKAHAAAEAVAHSQTTIALVRVEEQLRHLTNLFERQFSDPPPRQPRARSAAK